MDMVRTTRVLSLLLLLGATALHGTVLHAQQDDDEARARELAQRMRVTLERQARDLSRMQRDIERAARADVKVRDSIVRATSQQIAELATEIARVQLEADRAQRSVNSGDARTELRAQIASARAIANVTRALAGQQRALIFTTRTVPRGYLGVTLSSEQRTEVRDGKVVTVFDSPTLIESVVPDSPAARGGLSAGDTILAFGSMPVPGSVPLSELLTPGEKLTVKVRRAGRDRQVTVTVGNAQPGTMTITTTDAGPMRWCTGDDCPAMVMAAPRPPSPPGVAAAPSASAAAAAPTPPAAAAGPRYNLWSSGDNALLGAVMTTITDDLEELTGTDEGVLVLRVAPGTPAATSGLRGGDVIVRVGEDECEGVRDLQVAVQRASVRGARSVQLTVRRKRVEREVTLRW